MRIVNLIENTAGADGCAFAHGLSFYIETVKHKLLVDAGPSAQTLDNASKLGIDISQVDTMILSHGHYDHSGGILPFAAVDPGAQILMQRTATLDHYADDGENAEGERFRYIGIDKKIPDLAQVRFVDGDVKIDEELELFTVKQKKIEIPFTNKRLLRRTAGGFERDTFDHEQYLVISCEGR
ncbi:MAG: MBL fold metallo-hydrolase, partial [Lachnospiraceae bacterium]|nr:MBL fold metallo-hydrolase [Lachnospiraceae bacterium]